MNQDIINRAKEVVEAVRICGGSTDVCDGCPFFDTEEEECQDHTGLERQAADLLTLFLVEAGKAHHEEGSGPPDYWSNITAINARQEAKGRGKYGQDLEDNTTLTTIQRIEHAQEEAIDLLKYLEHLKQTISDEITANDYQRAALRTANGEKCQDLMNGVLGLCGETGEVADIVKKATFQGHDLDNDHIAEELGDVAWYLAIAAHAIGYNLGDIFQMNVEKLKKRYPDGFDKSRSIHREEEQA